MKVPKEIIMKNIDDINKNISSAKTISKEEVQRLPF